MRDGVNALSSLGRPQSLQPRLVIGTSHTQAHGQLFCGYAFELLNKEGAVLAYGHSYPKILKGDHTKAVLPAIIHAMGLLNEPQNIVVVTQLEYQISALNQRSLGPANTNYKRSSGKGYLADYLALRQLDEALA